MNIEKALVVDDSKVAHLTLRKLLSERGITVDWVGSGEESIDYLKKQQPDVVFMDVMMPGMDGFETASAVNGSTEIAAPPIIMCSANTTEEDKQTASNNGATGFLTKPYTAEELDEVLMLVRNMTAIVDVAPDASEDEKEITEIEISSLDDSDLDLSIAPLDLDEPQSSETELDAPLDFDLDSLSVDSVDSVDSVGSVGTAGAVEPPAASAQTTAPAAVASQVSDAELMHRVEQSAWSTADEVARRVATETSREVAEQAARDAAGSFARKATQVAARAAQSIAERVAQETAKSVSAEALSNVNFQANAGEDGSAGINIEGLRQEISDSLEEQIGAKVQNALTIAMQSDEFREQIVQLAPQADGAEASDVAGVAREAATKAAWEAIASKEEDDNFNNSAANKVANTALLFSLLALVLSGGLFLFTFFL